jgi:hypothetical protein
VKVLDRQVFDRGGPSHVQAFLHAVLFPSVRLLVVHCASSTNKKQNSNCGGHQSRYTIVH